VSKEKYQATESWTYRKSEHSGRRCTSSSIIRVLLGSGSDGDLLFHEKGTPMHFPYSTRQVPLLWNMLNENFLTKGKILVVLKFLEYSSRQDYTLTRDDQASVWPHSWLKHHERVRNCSGLSNKSNHHWSNHFANEEH
jgi:hypothetical protein